MSKSKKRLKIILVAGARPNFMKIAPLMREIEKNKEHFDCVLVHTGQHYNPNMSEVFFKELGIRRPDYNLGVGSGSHAYQTSKIIEEFEKVVIKENPVLVVVVGDVNSTVACSLVAVKLKIPTAHVEAGLRSFNRDMPEEINRIVTDSISEFLFTTEKSANDNLLKEGVSRKKIHFVGNIMIDTLKSSQKRCAQSKIIDNLNLKKKQYVLLTLHRAENVDNKEKLGKILDLLNLIGEKIPVIYPAHPRTRSRIKEFGLENKTKNNALIMIDPVGYLDFLNLEMNAVAILTDSGGIQEEATVLKTPCLTLRSETERPITAEIGTNVVVGMDKKKIMKNLGMIANGKFKKGKVPKYWDGKTAQRITRIIRSKYAK